MADPNDKRVKLLLERHPDYQSFTAADLDTLHIAELRTIIGAFAFKLDAQKVIPQSFINQHGDAAAGEFMLAIQREAMRRGKTELCALATLNGGISGAANKIINADVPASVTLADNSVRQSTAPKILNFRVAQDALELMAKNEAARRNGTYTPQTIMNVTVPQSVVAAIAAVNNLPPSIAAQSFGFQAADEVAFLSGYATRAGASKDIGPVTMQYPASAVCAVPNLTNQIFNPNKPDVDAALAWAAGYIQSDVDQMPATQRNAALAACPARKSASR